MCVYSTTMHVLINDYPSVYYLFLLLMCTEALTTAWTKFYCQYQKDNRELKMVSCNQAVGKGISGVSL